MNFMVRYITCILFITVAGRHLLNYNSATLTQNSTKQKIRTTKLSSVYRSFAITALVVHVVNRFFCLSLKHYNQITCTDKPQDKSYYSTKGMIIDKKFL